MICFGGWWMELLCCWGCLLFFQSTNFIQSNSSTNQTSLIWLNWVCWWSVDERESSPALLFLPRRKDFSFAEWNELRGKRRNEAQSIYHSFMRMIIDGFHFSFLQQTALSAFTHSMKLNGFAAFPLGCPLALARFLHKENLQFSLIPEWLVMGRRPAAKQREGLINWIKEERELKDWLRVEWMDWSWRQNL